MWSIPLVTINQIPAITLTMTDKRFDMCEAIWSEEFAMQRLLSLLRQSQSYCTDEECYNMPNLPGPPEVPSPDFTFFCLAFVFFVLMIFYRPNSLRRLKSNSLKDWDNGHDSNNDPSAPPSAAQ